MKKLQNYAFIDAQNLHLGVNSLGWKLDYQKFRHYLRGKYKVAKAFIFIGYIKKNEDIYENLKSFGYELIFKPTLESKRIPMKGNCDAELVLQAMIEYENYKKAVIVTGDGDFHCLVKHLMEKEKLEKILAPHPKVCSSLLRHFPGEYLAYVGDAKERLERMKRTQLSTET